jgi:hypothetical protein
MTTRARPTGGEIAPNQKRARPFSGQAELLRRLEYAAYHAVASKHPPGPLVAKELPRIAELIMRDGKGAASTIAALQALASPAVDIERDTGAPVAKQLTAAIRLYTKPPEQKPYVSPQQFIRRMHFKRQLRAMKRPPG